jgi:predicted lipoprotein with Yx(FWY)xxD motif
MQTGYARAGRLAALAAAVVVVVAACGGAATAKPYAAPAATTEAPSAEAGGYEVTTATSATAGPYLVGENGLTLYIFKKDTGSTSNCYDKCAAAWPPFLVEGSEAATGGDGVTGTFATTDRTDGTKQVTYNGAPLYYFQGDKAAGDTTGQGLNDVWFVAAP